MKNIFILLLVSAITLYAASANPLSIQSVVLEVNGNQFTQSRSNDGGPHDGSGSNHNINEEVFVRSITIKDGNKDVVLDNFATESLSVHNVNIPFYVRSQYLATMNNHDTNANHNSFTAKITELFKSTDIRDYLRYENNNRYTSIDLMYDTYTIDSDDYLFFQERHGNSTFTIVPLDAQKNQISNSETITFRNGSMNWNTGYKAGSHSHQKQYFGVIKASDFNIGSHEIHGFRIENSNGADPKFFALSQESFTDPTTLELTGILRDFSSSHPDFEMYGELGNWDFSGLVQGIVKSDLGPDKKPVFNRTSKSTRSKESFDQWYNDVQGVNQGMEYTLTLEEKIETVNGIEYTFYEYDSAKTPVGNGNTPEGFFPLDGKLMGDEGNKHNYHMTYELHTKFTYQGGETFTFSGDDDVWVFIDGKLVVDIGGIHSALEDSIALDTLGLTVGESYDLDMFWAERQKSASNFKITTSIELVTNNDVSGVCYALSDSSDKFYTVKLTPGATNLPVPAEKSIGQTFNGEGSAYRAIDNKIYAFKAQSDSEGPSNLYSVDVNTSEVNPVKVELIPGAVEGAEFYYDESISQEILYIISGESNSELYAFNSTNWKAITGYPKTIGGDGSNLSSIAIDPLTGDAYAIDDYNWDNKKPKLYHLNLKNANTTELLELSGIADAEGLAFASDGNLYVEDEGRIDGRKIYKIDLSNGNLIPAALLGGNSDIEGISCNGTELSSPKLLISEYRFDACEWVGNEGEVKDSVGEHHSTVNSAKVTHNAKLGKAALFDHDQSETVFTPDYKLNDDPFSISFWINPSKKPTKSFMGIFTKELEVYLRKNMKLSINLKNGEEDIQSQQALALNTWSHVALINDGENITVYINGTKSGSRATNNIASGNCVHTLVLGRTSWDGAERFQGSLDEFKIFKGALETSELSEVITKDNQGNNYDGTPRSEVACLNPIGCIEQAIVIDDTKFVHEVDLATGESITYEMNATQVADATINGFGYNVKDGYLWGSLRAEGASLVRVGKDAYGQYAQEKVGPIEGLPDYGTYVGDVDQNGHLHLYYKNQPEIGTHTMYVIDLDKNSTNYQKIIDSYTLQGPDISDMAFNPIDNQLYGIEGDNDFFKINIDTYEVTLLKENIIPLGDDSYGSSFFDSTGIFYAIKNTNREIVRAIYKEEDNGSTYVQASIIANLLNNNVQNVSIDGGRCNLAPILIDYGDAPDTYKTSLDENGPRHKLDFNTSRRVMLGVSVDSEPDAIIENRDIDNGLVNGFKTLYTTDTTFSAKFRVKNDKTAIAKLVGWIDFNRNGIFEKKEGVSHIINAQSDDIVTLEWELPDDLKEGETYARFRVTTEQISTENEHTYGIKSDGEVEDYKLTIKKGNLFDAWGTNEGNSTNPVIFTKVVDKEILLMVASIDQNRDLTENIFKNVKAGLFAKDGTQIYPYQDINFSVPLKGLTFEPVADAYKYAYVKFQYDDDNNVTHESNATDPFAIRPNAFKMQINPEISVLKAGVDFNITLEMINHNGNIVGDSYNENKTVYQIQYTETNPSPNCMEGALELEKNDFLNSQTRVNANYNEVGIINIKVSEVDGYEFALIDKDDGSDEQRFISADDQTTTVSPAKIDAQHTFETLNSMNDYTYYSNQPHIMGALLDINVSVTNQAGDKLHNFTEGCYAENISVNYDLVTTGDISNVMFTNEDGVAQTINMNSTNIGYEIPASSFLNGFTSNGLRINFGREKNSAKPPVKIEIRDITTAHTTSGVDDDDTLNTDISFIYVKAYVPSQSIEGNTTLDATVNYEVFLPNASDSAFFGLGSNLEASGDHINWYNIAFDNSAFLYRADEDPKTRFVGATVTSFDDPRTISILATTAPHNNRVKYFPRDYLIFNRFNANAGQHSFQVSFYSQGAEWSGEGEQGSTLNNKASTIKSKKLDW